MIYFIQSDCPNGYIKVGFTKNLYSRLDAIQTSSAYALNVLRVVKGGRKDEHAVHAKFSFCRVRGEWFHPSVELVGYIESLAPQCLGARPEREKTTVDIEHMMQRSKVLRVRASLQIAA